ncbi:MAG: hypothetical protein F4Z31_18600 [Gemmatimonadetes bacterium]|nr:hypothetical protein [Gemmatimonadota bacterium]
MSEEAVLELKFLGALVEQLGAQMYPSATATIAELISNAWDADAANVWVEFPFGEPWTEDSKIVVLDDGHGMTRAEAADQYLVVGRKRRVEARSDESRGGRLLHGRKGIGKLAAFGTARVLECYSVAQARAVEGADTNGVSPISFRLDYDHIRRRPVGSSYETEAAQDLSPLVSPCGREIVHGTRITLSGLRMKRAIGEARFLDSMSRRFALDASEMRIHFNGLPLSRFNYDVQIRLPRDMTGDRPREGLQVDGDWASEELADGQRVRWWIGFTEKPLADENQRGISVIARGKMAQRPFHFERVGGVSNQLGLEYMVGEVEADWLDEGWDIGEDRIQANRDQLRLEDDTLDPFLTWGRKLVAWALRERRELRTGTVKKEIAAELEELLAPFTTDQRKALRRIPAALAATEMSSVEVMRVMHDVVNARDDQVVRQMWEDIDKEAPDAQVRIWDVIHRFGLIDARRNQTIIETRLKAIDQLKAYVEEGAKEVPTIHRHIKENVWLLDPRWHLLGDEVHLEDLGIKYEPEPDVGKRMDYLFAMQPSAPSTVDEILVVEIKRAKTKDGRVHRVSGAEVTKFQDYLIQAEQVYARDEHPPQVSGIMIADGFSGAARQRSKMEIPGVRLHYRTWARVIRETERLHRGWLTVATRRADSTERGAEH